MEYAALLREKVEQLGRLSSRMARDDDIPAVLHLRSDISIMFDHLGVRAPVPKRGKPLVEVFANEAAAHG